MTSTASETLSAQELHESGSADGLIRILPDSLANKIAAGEVVQRPASVVKELMENAIDAGATEIQVVVKKAGSDLIQIVDNGCGMSSVDARACFGRHATSKLTAIEDLDSLATLGFRGEALASIASVAQVELRTRRAQDDAGTKIRIDGGKLVEEVPVATPSGTSVSVRNLFYNVPARRNFLKTPATEFKHIVDAFQTQALSNPYVAFSLVHDEMEVYRLGPSSRSADVNEVLLSRIGELFPNLDISTLIPVEETTSYLSVAGFIGPPHDARKTRRDQFVFINDRYVQNRSVMHAVKAAYGELLPDGRHPFMALFLTMEPRHVDVNVHPAKTEVKFEDDRGVYGFMKAVVKKGLASAGLALPFDASYSSSITVPARESGGSRLGVRVEGELGNGVDPLIGGVRQQPRGPEILGSETLPASTFDIATFQDVDDDSTTTSLRFPSRVTHGQSGEAAAPPVDPDSERPIWQFHGRYIMTPIRFGLMILDQQAAHERVLYERALAAMEGGLGGSQQLLFAATVDLDPADFALVEELQADLKSLGFDLELLSGRSVFVRGIPTEIQIGAEETILEEVLTQFRQNEERFQISSRENLARSMARRSSIKAGQVLKTDEARALIDQLFECRMPYADPLGRPTMIKISLEELARRFGRPPGR